MPAGGPVDAEGGVKPCE